MCLVVDSYETVKLRQRLEAGPVAFQKVFTAGPAGTVLAVIQLSPVKLTQDNAYVSDRVSVALTETEKCGLGAIVDRGIHVFTLEADVDVRRMGVENFIVKAIGKLEDFVAASNESAVFTKVYIDPQELEEKRKEARIAMTREFNAQRYLYE